MNTKDSYFSISDSSEGFYKDRGSKFYSYAFPCKDDGELKKIVDLIKKKHHDARHHCYAYRFKSDYSLYRTNDDGEPTNAAGKPILGQIDALKLTNTVVIVARYFGGVKLGVGGMMNAYKEAAKDALSDVHITENTIDDIFLVRFGYPEMNTVMRIIKELDLNIIKQTLELDGEILFTVRKKESSFVYHKFIGLKNIHISKM